MKKYHPWTPNAECLFGENAWAYLPAYLNKRGVTVDMLERLRLARCADIVQGLVVSVLSGNPTLRRNRCPSVKYEVRIYFRRNSLSMAYNINSFFRQLNKDLGLTYDWRAELERKVKELVEDNGLYDTPEGVKAKKGGTFSYGQTDQYDQVLSEHREVTCPSCDHDEIVSTFDEDDPETILQFHSTDFTHLTGPYAKCNECGEAVRPIVSEATSLPDNFTNYDDDQWDQYKEHLGYLITQLTEHCEKHGLTAPDKLMVTANNLDWRGRSGYTVTGVDGEELADAMRVNSDFCIYNGQLWLEPDGSGYLSCTMAHHDVPTGGGITVWPMWACDLGTGREDEYVRGDELADAKVFAEIATVLLTGVDEVYEYSTKTTFALVSRDGLVEALETMASHVEVELTPHSTALDGLRSMLHQAIERLVRHVRHRNTNELLVLEAKNLREHFDLMLNVMTEADHDND